MTIEALTGKIFWDLYVSPAATPGTYPVTVKVFDSSGNTDYQSFTLTVLD